MDIFCIIILSISEILKLLGQNVSKLYIKILNDTVPPQGVLPFKRSPTQTYYSRIQRGICMKHYNAQKP